LLTDTLQIRRDIMGKASIHLWFDMT